MPAKPSLSPSQLLAFYTEVEKLKTTLRHSWLNDGIRQESVAEHTWMMSLLAITLINQIGQKLDLLKVMKMITLHDLAEAVTTDTPVWKTTSKEEKTKAETAAMNQIVSHLDPDTAKNLLDIWQEYERRDTPEALFVKALDTLDVIVQHNVAPTETWSDKDYEWQLSPIQDAFFDFDVFLKKVKDEIDAWSIRKAKEAGNLSKLDQVELKKRLR